MTVTEFARKYELPHSVVYNAHFRIPYEDRSNADGDYTERELYIATAEELKSSIEYHKAKLNKSKERLLNIKYRRS